jgi:hypothetical protein
MRYEIGFKNTIFKKEHKKWPKLNKKNEKKYSR